MPKLMQLEMKRERFQQVPMKFRKLLGNDEGGSSVYVFLLLVE